MSTSCVTRQGLGFPGLSKESAEKEALKRAIAESCASTYPGGASTLYTGGRGARSSSLEAELVASDIRATEEELEQAVRAAGGQD